MQPTLVLLAAGMGSRFGGLKQLEPVGPDGSTLMEYAIHDAVESGFGKVVFIVREETEPAFRAALEPRVGGRVPMEFVHQRIDSLPNGFSPPATRKKPWGTGHAVLCTEMLVQEPFVVINADDYYGKPSFGLLHAFLREHENRSPPVFAMLGYRLRDTVSRSGAVSRGVCRVSDDGSLESIEEVLGIEPVGDGARYPKADGTDGVLTGEERVSMNIWAFSPAVFGELRSGFERFLRKSSVSEGSEFLLPTVIEEAMRRNRAQVRVIPCNEAWFGLTHPEDRDQVSGNLADLVRRGAYPSPLWNRDAQ